jgi:hypothetical protein
MKGPTKTAGVSDQQTPSQPYYFIGANLDSVAVAPEPSSIVLASSLRAIGAWNRLSCRKRT